MTDLTLYHNPRCSKSRGALELLEARGLTPTVVRYLETPLDAFPRLVRIDAALCGMDAFQRAHPDAVKP